MGRSCLPLDLRSRRAPVQAAPETYLLNLLGISRQGVDYLAKNDPTFPAPLAVLSIGRVWERRDVEKWARETGWISARKEELQGESEACRWWITTPVRDAPERHRGQPGQTRRIRRYGRPEHTSSFGRWTTRTPLKYEPSRTGGGQAEPEAYEFV